MDISDIMTQKKNTKGGKKQPRKTMRPSAVMGSGKKKSGKRGNSSGDDLVDTTKSLVKTGVMVMGAAALMHGMGDMMNHD